MRLSGNPKPANGANRLILWSIAAWLHFGQPPASRKGEPSQEPALSKVRDSRNRGKVRQSRNLPKGENPREPRSLHKVSRYGKGRFSWRRVLTNRRAKGERHGCIALTFLRNYAQFRTLNSVLSFASTRPHGFFEQSSAPCFEGPEGR